MVRLREGEHVSTLAPVVGSDDDEVELVKTTSDAPAPAEPAEPSLEEELLADADEVGPVEDEDPDE